MLRDEIIDRLRGSRAELDALGVRTLDLFGSVARGDERPDSDIDLIVEFAVPVGLFEITRIRLRLEQLLGRKVDLVPRDGLKPRVRERVLGESVRAA